MIDYYQKIESHLTRIREENRYRKFVGLERHAGNFPYATHIETGNQITLWCINDYLGMGQKKQVIEPAIESFLKMGAGTGGTRNIGGNNYEIVKLEQTVAKLHDKEAGLVFTSGYVSNDTTLSTLAKLIPGLVFISDEENHASIIHGIRNSRSEKYIYNHLDMNNLENILKDLDIFTPKIIVFESIYSMNGYESPIETICDLAQKYNALTYVDEVHTVGLYGKNGSGISSLRGCSDRIDIIQGTLGKAIGVFGGYITGSKNLIEAIRLSAPGFIFTTALPPYVATAAIHSINHLMNSDEERDKHRNIVAYFKSKLDNAGIEYLKNNSHIVPVLIGDPILSQQATDKLLFEHKIFVQNINFPTVSKGTERLRFTPTPCHTEEMVDELIESLKQVFSELSVKKSFFPVI